MPCAFGCCQWICVLFGLAFLRSTCSWACVFTNNIQKKEIDVQCESRSMQIIPGLFFHIFYYMSIVYYVNCTYFVLCRCCGVELFVLAVVVVVVVVAQNPGVAAKKDAKRKSQQSCFRFRFFYSLLLLHCWYWSQGENKTRAPFSSLAAPKWFNTKPGCLDREKTSRKLSILNTTPYWWRHKTDVIKCAGLVWGFSFLWNVTHDTLFWNNISARS